MSGRRIMTATDVDAGDLDRFLRRFYSEDKTDFLREHGAWWHRGDENRWILEEEGRVAAYCAVIPGKVLVDGATQRVSWWVDLIVAPEFRGRGLQRVFDEAVKASAPLILGFPNLLAAGIHRKHGWGVVEDLRVLLLPLHPFRVGTVRRARGLSKAVLTAGAALAALPAALYRRNARKLVPSNAWRAENPDPDQIAGVQERLRGSKGLSTVRDRSWIEWRYLRSPFRADLRFFCAGSDGEPEVVLVTRIVRRNGQVEVRILDLFGTLENRRLIRSAIRLAIREAVEIGAVQATVLTSNESVRAVFRRLGFIGSSVARFCWWSDNGAMMESLASGDRHLVLADSDSDE